METNSMTKGEPETQFVEDVDDVSDNDDSFVDDYDISNIKGKSCIKRYFSCIRGGSLRGGTLAMASITFGGGCLSFPYAIAQSGPVIGLIIFVVIGLLSYLTLKYLLWNGLDSKLMDYNKLTTEAGGNNFRVASDINNLILCFGLLVSYEYIISSLVLQSLNYFFGLSCDGNVKIIQIAVTAVLFLIPLSSLKDIAKLQYLSIIGTIALILSILVIMVEFPFYLNDYIKSDKPFKLFPDNWEYGWIDTAGIFLFGFSSHNGIFQIFNELHRPGPRRCNKVLNRAFYLEFVLYILLSFSGYFSTFEGTPDVFIKRADLPGYSDKFIMVVRILLAITMTMSVAVNYNIMRMSINSMFFEANPSFGADLIISVAIYAASNLLMYFVKNAGTLLSFLGGVTTVWICFVVPIIIDISISKEKKSSQRKYFNYVFLIGICLLGLLCIGKSVYDFITTSSTSNAC